MTKDSKQLSLFEGTHSKEVFRAGDAFEAARLTQARTLAGLTKQALAEKLRVSPAAIGQFESRVTPPRAELVAEIAEVLNVPVGFFYAGRPLGRLDAAAAHFRSLRSTRSADRARAATFVEQVWELCFALEKRIQFPEVDLPIAEAPADQVDPVEAARAVRRAWGVAPGPFRHLVATLESRGIVVTILALSNDAVARVDAFSTGSLGRPIVVVTPERASTVYRHRFTCAHELGHLIMHSDVAPGDLQQEREADAFAAELLTPSAEIELVLPRTLRLSELDRIGRSWGVSPESLIRRMQELRPVPDTAIRRAYQRLRSANEFQTAEPVAAYRGEMPTMLLEGQRLAEQHGFSLIDLANELMWPVSRVREILGAEDTRPKLQLVP
ncbi:XRE family transcriptional regulator [Arthrobacter sp. Soil736]|uniref:helix-turn-helix domain-containing protein n=1 Tax=Arthrobacter sp. Soil736 TaxID=1736395 RepID=UPI0009E9589A|nr:XRE family transcriptional regulator [Arthrobacter sp. Soil736]